MKNIIEELIYLTELEYIIAIKMLSKQYYIS
jgi:hypothetical protein